MHEDRPGGVRRWVGLTVFGALGALVIGPLVWLTVAERRSDQRRDRLDAGLQAQVDAAYRARGAPIEDLTERTVRRLRPALGEPVHRSRVVWCSVSGVDAGFVRQSYGYTCQVQTFDVYRAPGEAETRRRLAPLGADGLLGAVPDRAERQCGRLRTADGVTITWRAARTGTYDPTADVDDNGSQCQDPAPVAQQVFTSEPPSRELARVDRRFTGTPDPDEAWLYVERNSRFIDEDLGCAGTLTCEAPISGAVLPRY